MNVKLKEKIRESLSAVLPITGIVLLLSSVLIPLEIGVMAMFFAEAFMLIIGMGMFQLGVEMSMSPLGEGMGASLAKSCKLGLATVVSLAMGVLVTIAEPEPADFIPAGSGHSKYGSDPDSCSRRWDLPLHCCSSDCFTYQSVSDADLFLYDPDFVFFFCARRFSGGGL